MLILGLENVMREGVDSNEQITVTVTARIRKRTERGDRKQYTSNRPSYC